MIIYEIYATLWDNTPYLYFLHEIFTTSLKRDIIIIRYTADCKFCTFEDYSW